MTLQIFWSHAIALFDKQLEIWLVESPIILTCLPPSPEYWIRELNLKTRVTQVNDETFTWICPLYLTDGVQYLIGGSGWVSVAESGWYHQASDSVLRQFYGLWWVCSCLRWPFLEGFLCRVECSQPFPENLCHHSVKVWNPVKMQAETC